jgi:hypothetical protein
MNRKKYFHPCIHSPFCKAEIKQSGKIAPKKTKKIDGNSTHSEAFPCHVVCTDVALVTVTPVAVAVPSPPVPPVPVALPAPLPIPARPVPVPVPAAVPLAASVPQTAPAGRGTVARTADRRAVAPARRAVSPGTTRRGRTRPGSSVRVPRAPVFAALTTASAVRLVRTSTTFWGK